MNVRTAKVDLRAWMSPRGKKQKYNLISEGCWGEDKVGWVSVPGIPQPYQPLPQRLVVRRGRRGCVIYDGKLTRPKPGIFASQDIRSFFVICTYIY